MWTWSAIAAMAQERCDPAVPVSEALTAVLAGDDAGARRALEQAQDALACGPPAIPATLATGWIVDAALSERSGDRVGAEGSLASARRLAPTTWPEGLPETLRQLYQSIPPLDGEGALQLTPLPGRREVWIDGEPRASYAAAAGLHGLQVGDGAGRAVFAEIVWVDPGVTSVIATGLPPLADPVPVEPPQPRSVPVDLALLVGLEAARGQALDAGSAGAEWHEPATRVSVPVEVTGTLERGWGWVRGSLGGGPLLRGRLLYQPVAGAPVVGFPAHLDAGAGVGVRLGEARVGVSGGVQWPARLAGRASVGWWPRARPWTSELRLGANLATSGRPLEPAAELLLGVRLK